jgi:hypothetical protein
MNDAANLAHRTQINSVPAAGSVDEANKLDSFGWMPCTLSLEIPIVGFTITDLIHLTGGSLVESAWSDARDVPLRVNKLLVAWAQFEADGDRMCALITDLA